MDLQKDLQNFYQEHEAFIAEDYDSRFFFGIAGDLKMHPDSAHSSIDGRAGNIEDAMFYIAKSDKGYAALFLQVAERLTAAGYHLTSER